MKTKSLLRKLLMIISISTVLLSCENPTAPKEDLGIISEKDSLNIKIQETRVTKLIYTLPSPIETAMILKKAGASYNEDFLNKIENADRYINHKLMALNLGIYCADLSYASLHEQNQTSIKYMGVSKKLADRLGIMNAIDKTMVKRLESNVNNRDSILHIITESFYNTNSYLTDNNRTHIAKMILAGGWIEGVYISSQLAKTSKNNTEIINRLVEQKLSLENLIDMLQTDSKTPTPEMLSLITEFKELDTLFDKVKINSTEIESIVNTKNKITTLAVKSNLKKKISKK